MDGGGVCGSWVGGILYFVKKGTVVTERVLFFFKAEDNTHQLGTDLLVFNSSPAHLVPMNSAAGLSLLILLCMNRNLVLEQGRDWENGFLPLPAPEF